MAMNLLISYAWPGNVRELENIIERAVILEDTEVIREENLPFTKKTGQSLHQIEELSNGLSIKKAEEELEKTLIRKALEMTNGNKTKAAHLLEISHRALIYKIKEFGL